MGVPGFDRAKSNRVDSTAKRKPQGWGDSAEEAKNLNANDSVYSIAA